VRILTWSRNLKPIQQREVSNDDITIAEELCCCSLFPRAAKTNFKNYLEFAQEVFL